MQIPVYEDVTDKDQSPELSSKFVEEEEFAQKQMKKTQALLERQDKREHSIENGVDAIASYIDEEMGAFKRQVLRINIEDTSTIDTIVPTKGPDGVCVRVCVRAMLYSVLHVLFYGRAHTHTLVH